MKSNWIRSVAVMCLLAVPIIGRTAEFMTDEGAVGRLFDRVDQRLAIMPAVAAVKWQTHAPIYDPARENAVIQKAQDLAVPMGLEGEPVKRLFSLQARLAREVQSSLHGDWKAHGFSYGEPVTSLASLRPRLDQLTLDLLQALYVAAPVLRPEGFEEKYRKLADERLRSPGWNDENRRELLEALHAVLTVPSAPMRRITSSGVLRVGTTGDYAPFSLETNGVLDGSDIKLAQELAARLQVRAVFVHTAWASLAADLDAGLFDLALGGVSITPAREAQGAFSVPYATGGKTILARCADVPGFRDGLRSVDRAKVRVIVNPGGTNEQFVREHIHHARIVVFPDNRGVFDELAAGRADVMITDDVEAELQARRHPGLCRAISGTLTRADKAVFMPRDAELVKAVDDWLAPSVAAGEPARLLNEYLR